MTPFSLDPTPTTSRGQYGTIYTFRVLSNTPIDPSSPCANTTLYKVEFWSNAACQSAMRRTYINSRVSSPSWDQVYNVYKVLNIGFSPAALPGTQVGTIGIELESTGTCPTLQRFCRLDANGNCVASLFDYSKTCCPLSGFSSS